MTRFKKRTLVVPVLGALLMPTAWSAPLARVTLSARRTARGRRATRKPQSHAILPPHKGAPAARMPIALQTVNARALVSNAATAPRNKRDRRRGPRALFSLGAVGVALVVAGCGAAAGSSGGSARGPAQTSPAAAAGTVTTPAPAAKPSGAAASQTAPAAGAPTATTPAATPPTATTPAAPAPATPVPPATPATPKVETKAPEKATAPNRAAGIPQGNGGDGDSDNNGGPSDGDGDI